MRTLIHADVISDDQRGLVFQFVPSEFRRFGLELTNMLVNSNFKGPGAACRPQLNSEHDVYNMRATCAYDSMKDSKCAN